ncbi:MAG TPA: cupin domain-containing protein [Gaiellaceae bacterium]|nr:cupin domain-containing protein [Gaiellaceae bacterium]
MDERIVVDPVLRQRLRFERTTDADGGDVLHVETWVDPGGGVTPHRHPAMEERFEVLAGEPTFLAGRAWSTASSGETVVVPAGTRHAYRNRGAETVHMVCHVRPPSSLQEFLEEVAALARDGKISRRGLPTSYGALLEAAALAQRHRAMVTLLFPPMPPPFIQRLLFPLLTRLGGRRKEKPNP